MPRPPRKRRINTKVECDAFGCRPKTTIPKEGKFDVFGGGKVRREPKPVPRYDWEVEKTEETRGFSKPDTDVTLDISEVGAGGEKQLFRGTYQDAQLKDALKAASESSKTFTQSQFPKFQKESEKLLVKGGADPRTISPTSRRNEKKFIGAKMGSTIKEQAMRQMLGADYDIAKEGKLRSRTQYRTDPKTKERIAVKRIEYSPEAVNEMNLETGRMKITDLTTGENKYEQSETVDVKKRPMGKAPVAGETESIVETEGEGDVSEKEIKKAQLKAAAEMVRKKPGYFSKEAIRARQRTRRRRRYAQGSR